MMIGRKTFIYRFIFTTLTLLLIATGKIYGVGAIPYPQKIEQPNGKSITMKINGDEWFNWVSTTDGYRIIKNNKGIYEYATVLKSGKIVASGIEVSEIDQRAEDEKNFISQLSKGSGFSSEKINEIREEKSGNKLKSSGNTYFPSSGTQKMLVILATFSDKLPTYSKSEFYSMMNSEGYNGTGSFRDYYLEVSNGQLDMESHVTDWVTVPNTYEYYGNDKRWTEFAYEAVKQAYLSGIDLSIFDNDRDGIIEGIAIIHQGAGQEVTGNTSDIWSHSFSFSSAGYSASKRTFNGVKIDQYTVQAEFLNAGKQMNTIGVICHEFGHNLGLPDYYDTDNETNGEQDGTGKWDLMASGNYNGSPTGSSPAHHNAFSKIELGWANESVISTAGVKTLEPIKNNPTAFRINGSLENEYFLLENRQKSGFDSYLPGHGMIVYHVDENIISSRRKTNKVNTKEHQGLYIKSANGVTNSSSAPFPGNNLATEFTDYTTPSMLTWTNVPYNRSITGIEENNGTIEFTFMAIQNGSPLFLKSKAVAQDKINLEWQPSVQNHPVMIAWSYDGIFGEPIDGQSYSVGQTITGGGEVLYLNSNLTTLNHLNLNPKTKYYYKAWSLVNNNWSSAITSNTTTLTTPITTFPWTDSFEEGLLNWTQEFVDGTFLWEAVNNGVNNRPESAQDGDNFARFFTDSYNGNSTMLVSPAMTMDNSKPYFIDFHHIQHPWETEQDILEIYAKSKNDEDWQFVTTFYEEEKEWTQRRLSIPNDEEMQIAFKGIGNYGYGIGIDNIKIFEGDNCLLSQSDVMSINTISSTENSITLSWNQIENHSILIIARKNKKVNILPEIGFSYNANSHFGEGDSIGDECFIVFSGVGSTATITNLDHTSDYYFSFFTNSETNCYHIDNTTYKESTVPVFYNMSIAVKDNDNAPINNTKITIDNSEFTTDINGKIYWAAKYDTLYKSVTFEHTDYQLKQIRLNATKDSVINVTLENREEIPAVRGIRYQKRNNTISLSWNPIINESFEYYPAFSLNIDGWTQIDGDKGMTYAIKDHLFPNQGYKGSFIVFKPHYEDVLQTDYDMTAPTGKHILAAFASVNAPNDDWLISPEFLVYPDDNISLYARSLTDKYGLESFRVLVSVVDTTEADNDFKLLFEDQQTPKEWTFYSHSLSDYEGKRIKFAIHYNSNDIFAILLDDIKICSNTLTPSPTSILKNRKIEIDNLIEKEINQSQTFQKAYKQTDEQGKAFGYKVKVNGDKVGNTLGFAQAIFRYNVENTDTNIFNIKAKDYFYNIESQWSDDISILGGYRIKFIVKDSEGNLIKNASITYNSETLFTSEDGEVVFDGVPPLIRQEYQITADGFIVYQNTIAPTSDRTIVAQLTDIVTDSTALTNGEEIAIYPNPIIKAEQNEFQFKGLIPGTINITITDVNGSTYLNKEINIDDNSSISISYLKTGFYIVKIQRSNNIMRFKILVI